MSEPLPKEHRDALGVAYYTAIGAQDTWTKVNTTGTVLSLLMISAEHAENTNEQIDLRACMRAWGDAMRYHEIETGRNHAAYICQKILFDTAKMVYKYGKIPSTGFKLPTQGGVTNAKP